VAVAVRADPRQRARCACEFESVGEGAEANGGNDGAILCGWGREAAGWVGFAGNGMREEVSGDGER